MYYYLLFNCEWKSESTLYLKLHRCRNRWGRSGHGLTTFLTCYYKAKSRVWWAMSLSHSLLAYGIACAITIGIPWVCTIMQTVKWAMQAVRPNCTNAQHSKVTHLLHEHLAWPIQFWFLRLIVLLLCCLVEVVVYDLNRFTMSTNDVYHIFKN